MDAATAADAANPGPPFPREMFSRIWQLVKTGREPVLITTPPPNRIAELLRMTQLLNSALERLRTPPPASNPVLFSKTTSVSNGEASAIANPPPVPWTPVPPLNVRPSIRIAPLALKMRRAVCPEPVTLTIVAAAPPTPRIVRERFVT